MADTNPVITNTAATSSELRPTNPGGERKRLLVLGSVFLAGIIGIVVTLLLLRTSQDLRSQASLSGPTLSLVPSQKTGVVGESFPVNILVDTHTDSISAVELHLSYDSKLLKITGFTTGSILPVVLKPESHDASTINVVLGVRPESPFKGSGILGTLNVQILGTSSDVKILSTTQVASIGKTTNTLDFAKSINTLAITTVPGGVTITPTLTSTPTPVSPLSFTTTSLPAGTQGRPYSTSISGQSRTPNDVLNITLAGLPFGVSEGKCVTTAAIGQTTTNVTCPIKGTPLKPGNFTVTATIVNNAGNKVTKSYSIIISPVTRTTPPKPKSN